MVCRRCPDPMPGEQAESRPPVSTPRTSPRGPHRWHRERRKSCVSAWKDGASSGHRRLSWMPGPASRSRTLRSFLASSNFPIRMDLRFQESGRASCPLPAVPGHLPYGQEGVLVQTIRAEEATRPAAPGTRRTISRMQPEGDSPMDILGAIGDTSLVRLRKVTPPRCADILVKLEWRTPPAASKTEWRRR